MMRVEDILDLDLEDFLREVFPPEWSPVIRVILESGATYGPEDVKWAPRWSPIPRTVKGGPTSSVAAVKSILYRSHDAVHQLWGLPVPQKYDEETFYEYKRAQMCGEVAVLLLVEFVLAKYLSEQWPDLAPYIRSRCAVPMLDTTMRGKSLTEMAARLDTLLHLKIRPRWCRLDPSSRRFCDYYEPMLQGDREEIDHNWGLLQTTPHDLSTAPRQRYDTSLDGRELTVWMIQDFEHILRSGGGKDLALVLFNSWRRSHIELPEGWGDCERSS